MFDFNVILSVDNFLSALACVTELAAVMRLRFTMPELERPYKLNVSDRALVAMLLIPFSIGTFVLTNEFTKSRLSMALNTFALVCGLLYHRMLRTSPSYVFTPTAGRLEQAWGALTPNAFGDTPRKALLRHDHTPRMVYT